MYSAVRWLQLVSPSKKDAWVSIIDFTAGAGFAGLAAANRLASKGIPVTVYDMGSRGPGDASLAAKCNVSASRDVLELFLLLMRLMKGRMVEQQHV